MVLVSVEEKPEAKEKKEKTPEELQKEVLKLKTRLKMTRCTLAQTRAQMELQSVRTRQLVTAWRERVKDAEEASRRQQEQKDSELQAISSQLLFLQGGLLKEKKRIQEILRDKDTVIRAQNKKMNRLKKMNRKMASEIDRLQNQLGRTIDNNHNTVNIKQDVDLTHEHNVDQSVTDGYNKRFNKRNDGYLDFPDVFDDRGSIRTPEGVLDLDTRVETRKECISISPSTQRKGLKLTQGVGANLPNSASDKQIIKLNEQTGANDDVFAPLETNTFPKRKPILKHSQSQGTFTLKHNALSDPYADKTFGSISPRDPKTENIVTNKRGHKLKHSQSQGTFTLHSNTNPKGMFYLENSFSRPPSVDFDSIRSPMATDSKQAQYEDMVGSYPDIVISAKPIPRRQRPRSNTLHSISPHNSTSDHVVNDKSRSLGQGQRRRMSSFTSGDESTAHDLFYTHSRQSSDGSQSTPFNQARQSNNNIPSGESKPTPTGKPLHRRMSSVTSTEGSLSDETFYIPYKPDPNTNEPLQRPKSKFNALRQKTVRRQRKRSTSEPGIEAAMAYLSLSEAKPEDGEAIGGEAREWRGGRRGRIHSVDSAV